MKSVVLLAAGLVLGAASASPQAPVLCQTPLRHPDPAAGDQFGCSVAAHAGTLAVGANLDDAGGRPDVGSVTLFAAGGTEPLQVLVPDDARADDEFGFSIAIAGDTMAVGAPLGEADRAADAGAVYVFRRQGALWVQGQRLVAADAARGDRFGQVLALDGDRLVVGAPFDGGAGSLSGAVYVFARDAAGRFAQEVELRPDDAAPFDQLGFAVAVEGGAVVAGAPFDDDGGDAAGAAYVFVREGGAWRQARKLTAPRPAANDQFGVAVALGGGELAVGARRADGAFADSGLVFVFAGGGAEWTLRQTLAPHDPGRGELFGVALALDGDRLVVGARGDGERGLEAGAAYLFERTRLPNGAAGDWVESGKLLGATTSAGDGFGQSVALSGAAMIAGAFLDEVGSLNAAGSATACAPASIDLVLAKAKTPPAPASVAPGEALTYTLTVHNLGLVGATGVTLVDPAPPGTTPSSAPPPAGCTRGPAAFTCSLPPLPPGGSASVKLSFDVPACYAGPNPIVNRATVTADQEEARPQDNSATRDTPVAAGSADLAIEKRLLGGSPVAAGGVVTYRLTVTNRGPHGACGTVVRDVVPAGLVFLDATRPCTRGPNGVECSLPQRALRRAGSAVTFDLRFQVPNAIPPCPGPIRNVATVSSRTSDPNPANDAAVTTPLACDDLAVTKTGPPDSVAPGAPVEFTLRVENRGAQPVSGATLHDVLPPRLAGVAWCKGAGCTPTQSAAPDGTITDTFALPPGGTEVYRVSGTAPLACAALLINAVTVAQPPGQIDGTPADNSATTTTAVAAPPGLSVFCVGVASTQSEGGTATYTFVLLNCGPANQADNPGDEFTDTLPAGLTLVSAAASSGTVTTLLNTVTWNGGILAGESVTITVEAAIDAGTTGMTLCNPATASFDANGDGTNESAATSDGCCFRVLAPVGEIPVASAPALAVFALVLLALALRRIAG
ncbi:MAG TPA: hypothetical protein VGC93_02490 [Thermoanaerobaculia bacterium]